MRCSGLETHEFAPVRFTEQLTVNVLCRCPLSAGTLNIVARSAGREEEIPLKWDSLHPLARLENLEPLKTAYTFRLWVAL